MALCISAPIFTERVQGVLKTKTDNKANSLSKELSVLDGWAVGTGAMIGVTIFVVSGQISGLAGPSAALGFLFAAIVVLFVALCYCEVAAVYPSAGGAYVYPRKAIGGAAGDLLSFVSGWGLWGGQGLGPAVVAMACASYITWMLELLGINNPIPELLLACLLILWFAISNMHSTGGGRAIQLISTFLIVGIMLAFIIWGGLNVKTALLRPFAPNGITAVFTATAICLLSYGGWSTIPAMAEEFKNPAKDVPKSMILSLLTCGIIFSVFVYVMNGLLPGSELAASSAPPAAAASTFTKYGALLVVIGGIFACVSTLNGLLMTGARIPFSMGRDGFLPSALGKVNVNGTPYIAIMLTAIGQILLAITGLMNLLVQMIVFVTSISWIISTTCLVFLRKKYPDIKAPFRAPGYPITLFLAYGGLILMLSRLAAAAIVIGTCWLGLGIILFYVFQKTGLSRFCEQKQKDEK